MNLYGALLFYLQIAEKPATAEPAQGKGTSNGKGGGNSDVGVVIMIMIRDISVVHNPESNLGQYAPYKKMQKNVSTHTKDKIKRFQAIQPPNHARIYIHRFQ